MKKLNMILISLLLTTGLGLNVNAQDLSNQQIESIKSEVEAVFQEMLVFAEKLDYDQLSSGVNDQRKAGFITNGKYYAEYSTLISEFKLAAQDVPSQDITVNEKKITVLTDKIVLMTASGLSEATLNDGRNIASNFHWSFVYEKVDDRWKVISSHQSLANK